MTKSQTPETALRRLTKRLGRNHNGAALVEFAISAPVRLAPLAAISDGTGCLLHNNAMNSGLNGSAHYVMSGGTDLSNARQIVLLFGVFNMGSLCTSARRSATPSRLRCAC